VVIVVFEGVKLLDAAGPAEVFAEANRFGADYRLKVASEPNLLSLNAFRRSIRSTPYWSPAVTTSSGDQSIPPWSRR
jgi:hypothetical protein